MHIKKPSYDAHGASENSTLQFSQLKDGLQRTTFNVVFIIWPMIIEFFLLVFSQAFREEKVYFLTEQMCYLSLSFSIDEIS